MEVKEMTPALRCVECSALIHPSALFCPSCVRADRPPKPPADPTTLGGRKVDGWGWKAFKTDGKRLYSEMWGRAQTRFVDGPFLPENQWLDYREWQGIGNPADYPFHILKSGDVATRWISRRFVESGLAIRRVAWRVLREMEPKYVLAGFGGDIFTAEEIYILPEEGTPVAWELHYAAPPGDRPPEKGDWVIHLDADFQPRELLRVEGDKVRFKEIGGFYWLDHTKVVRRAADRLREKDRVMFGSEEGWIQDIGFADSNITQYQVNFSKNQRVSEILDKWGWFQSKDLTLVAPVCDRRAEKGDC